MAGDNEKLSISKSSAESIERRLFADAEIFSTSRPALSPREREIAITAVSARAAGSPVESAKQVLAGIAVLDGAHLPILVWPENITRGERAAWHAAEAAYWNESAKSFAALQSTAAQSAARTLPSSPDAQSTDEQGEILSPLASFASTHHEVENESPLHSGLGVTLRASSDVC